MHPNHSLDRYERIEGRFGRILPTPLIAAVYDPQMGQGLEPLRE